MAGRWLGIVHGWRLVEQGAWLSSFPIADTHQSIPAASRVRVDLIQPS
jgi:hypothetical protein